MHTEEFRVEVHRRPGASVVAPAGEIDVATVGEVRARLRECEADAQVLVLDLREVGFMDTSGLQLVFEQQQRSAQSAHDFAVVRGSPRIQRLFDIAGFGDRLRLLDTPDELG